MATNPFDQFDAPAANPFDQFDAAPAAAPTGGIPGPRRSWSDVAKEAYTNAPSSLMNLYTGLAQAITSPVQTAQGLLDVGAGALQNITPKVVKDFVNRFETNPEAAQRAVEAANAVGGEYAKRYGSVEGFKNALATDPAGVAADFSTLMTGGAAATAKVAPTVSKTMATAGRVTNPLAPVGVAVNVAKYPLGAVGNVAEAVFNPKNALYMRAAEGQGPAIVNALRASQEIVPGSMPTAAQAAADTGVVGFQKMGKSAAGVLESEYKAREAAQAAAQLQVPRNIGQTPAAIAAKEAERASVTAPMYKAADETLSKADKDFTDLLQRPSMDQVMARAARLAAEKDIPFQIGKNVPEQRAPSPILNEAGVPIGETVTPATFAQFPGTSIHFIKQAFDDLTADPATFGIGASEARAINKTREAFLNWAEQTEKNPAYKQARETFAKMSEPINQMQVGQFLESKLTPALGEETARLRAAGYATALEQAPQTIKKATGETRYATLEKVFESDPEALKALHSVRDDLARQAKSERLAAGPVKKEFDVTRAAEAIAGETALPNMINRVTTVANDIWRRLRGRIDQNVAIEVAQEMLFPGKAADALEAALRQQSRRQAISAAAAAPARAVYVTPAIANMLAPQQQQQNRNALAQ